MLILQNISYTYPGKDLLFSDINLTLTNNHKAALIGKNGCGKSTLLKIIAGEIQPSDGLIHVATRPYYVPQVFGQFNHLTISQALGIKDKIDALNLILAGNTSEKNFNLLNDDWTIEDRCRDAMKYWHLTDLDLSEKMETLSGGEKTKVFLAGIYIHQPQLVLLDEPGNHLDILSRQLLYDFIESTKSSLLVVSHDRKLLNLLNTLYELTNEGIETYGGNYDFYKEQKELRINALNQAIQNKEKDLRKAREKERETLERQHRLDSRGKNKQEKAGVARIMMNTLRNKAENSTSKVKSVHEEKISGISRQLQDLRSSLPGVDKMKVGFDQPALHKGKILYRVADVNYVYAAKPLWKENINFEITSGERIALQGINGSGKTTLIKLLTGDLLPSRGKILNAVHKAFYIDQEYSLLDNNLEVYMQAQAFNITALQEHEIKIRLSHFLFTNGDWNKPCSALSGGERMRLLLCCLNIYNTSPDVIILDEPTNNLDIQNVEILTAAINEYRGTLIVVSHDQTFLEQINIERTIEL